ncbi:UNVERIFIED_CONTAM: hypothetical protein HDU68_000946 [Siphonaria sp. JEL0065]|nr:hypothetical protein HDU68_000946 [Siphonaria sp. JEL0065]
MSIISSTSKTTTYESTWASLRHFLRCVVSPKQHGQNPLRTFSHEVLYRNVYSLCLRPPFRRRLAADFTAEIEALLSVEARILSESPLTFDLALLAKTLKHEIWAATIIRDVFVYFEKAQSRSEAETFANNKQDLRLAFLSAVKSILIDPLELLLFDALKNTVVTSETMPPLTDLLKDLLLLDADCIALNIPLFHTLLPDSAVLPVNFVDLQIKSARLQALSDIAFLRGRQLSTASSVYREKLTQRSEAFLVSIDMHTKSSEAWGLFKDTLRKRTECEDGDDDDGIDGFTGAGTSSSMSTTALDGDVDMNIDGGQGQERPHQRRIVAERKKRLIGTGDMH